MCGIFGVVMGEASTYRPASLAVTLKHLFKLSESRGKEAAGLAVLSGGTIQVYKDAVSASELIRSGRYKSFLKQVLLSDGSSKGGGEDRRPLAIIGHSRLVTDGTQEEHHNNQPVIVDGAIGIHNGIVVNCEELWRQFPSLKRRYEVDTEVLLSLIAGFYRDHQSLVEAVKMAFSLIRGATSIAVLLTDINGVVLATNNGSLYVCMNKTRGIFIFSSEKYILQMLTKRRPVRRMLGEYEITQVKPGNVCLVNILDLCVSECSLRESKEEVHIPVLDRVVPSRDIVDVSPGSRDAVPAIKHDNGLHLWLPRILDRYPHDEAGAASLRRCTKCILPETMPFIEFGDDGVCNYCNNYKSVELQGIEALEELAARYRSASGEPDCVVGVSGGRDSTYGLHYIKTVLKMHPIAYTYDWGMVTDLARRNVSRICGKLGVEHILISADIIKKRRYIRKNVTAWLKRPELGMIPLFMAGDKQYFYYANKLKEQTGVELVFLCENPLERTDFKTGFAGVKPSYIFEKHIYSLTPADKTSLLAYYARQYILNPSYINASVPDTLFAYACYYFVKRGFFNLYNYIKWDEKTIVSSLIDEYDWELSPDTKSTWRIGDGTASFYNYIYYNVAGFTEIDTFRSNQIREGVLAREEALQLAREENKPRFETMKWYCDIIGIDLENALRAINSIPNLYNSNIQ